MGVRLAEPGRTVRFDSSLVEGLDLMKFSAFFLKGMDRENVEAWLRRYLTGDAEEISRRNALIYAFMDMPDALALLRELRASGIRIAGYMDALSRGCGRLARCTFIMRALTLYTQSVRRMRDALPADAAAFAEIRHSLENIVSSEAFSLAESRIQEVSAYFRPLENVALGVNVTEGGDALQMAVASANAWDEPVSGLIGGKGPVNGLLSAVPAQRNLAHLEAFIIGRVEKDWLPSLIRAGRALKAVPLEPVAEWLDFIAPAELYIAGLSYAGELLTKGLPLCAPAFHSESISFQNLYYPHMALAGEVPPTPHTAEIPRGSLTMITGANHSGKTSFLKTVAQACILAQTGLPVPAEKFEFLCFTKYIAVFSAGEDEGLRASRFQTEAEGMREALREADGDSLVLLNEPFTSTNPEEAATLLCDILRALDGKRATQMLVTHIYDVYFALRDEGFSHLRSYVTASEQAGGEVVHRYAVEEREPDGVSYARAIARQFGLEAGLLVGDEDAVRQITAYLSMQ